MKRPLILIADDDAVFAESVASILRMRYRVRTAANGTEAVFTSGNYERFRQEDTTRYPHILDPRSGWPVEDLASATVIAGEGLLADAAATALIVAGRSGWREVAQSLGLDQVLMIDGDGKVYMTQRMAGRIELLDGVENEIVEIIAEQ